MIIFIVIFGIVVLFVVDIFGGNEEKFSMYATVAYIVGSLTSMLSGFIGMKIATSANFRTSYKAISSL